jgi:hypothetical protein
MARANGPVMSMLSAPGSFSRLATVKSVAKVGEDDNRVQKMVAIGAAAGDLQAEVQLRRRRQPLTSARCQMSYVRFPDLEAGVMEAWDFGSRQTLLQPV